MTMLDDVYMERNVVNVPWQSEFECDRDYSAESGTYRLTSSNTKAPTLLMNRHSFGDGMLQFLPLRFSRIVAVHRDSFRAEQIDEENSDIFV